MATASREQVSCCMKPSPSKILISMHFYPSSACCQDIARLGSILTCKDGCNRPAGHLLISFQRPGSLTWQLQETRAALIPAQSFTRTPVKPRHPHAHKMAATSHRL